MKLTLFLIYVIIAVTTTTCLGQDMSQTSRIIEFLNLTETDAMSCINSTHVKREDLYEFDLRILTDIPSISNLSLNVGCFFACLAQKREVMSGSRINLDELKRWRGQIVPPAEIEQEHREKVYEIYDNCENEVRSKVDECEVALQFLPCIFERMKRNAEEKVH